MKTSKSVMKSINLAIKTMKKSVRDILKENKMYITNTSRWNQFSETDFNGYETFREATDTDETFDVDAAILELLEDGNVYIVTEAERQDAEIEYQKARLAWQNKKQAKSAEKSYKIGQLQKKIAEMSRELERMRESD